MVTESGAIVLYLARKRGKLMPRDLAGEAQVLRWSFAALTAAAEFTVADILMTHALRVQSANNT